VKRQAGFSLTELLVVLAIILIVGGLSIPTFSRSIDSARLKTASQQIASIYQQGRSLATRDDTFHEILLSAPLGGPAQICVDVDGDAVCEASEPQVQLPPQVLLISTGVPVELDSSTLGFSPLAASSTTYNQQNIGVHALAWNGRGLPCQRTSTTSGCTNWTTSPAGAGSVAWVQYLQMPQSSGAVAYAAVSVSPTGRIKTWTYAPGQNGGGSWF
jgi:prepilin-type N-terminal cleavage/methylation domain-containing protein